MPSITSVDDLDAVLEAIKADLRQVLPEAVMVTDFRLAEDGEVKTPALLLDLEQFEENIDAGFDPCSLRLNFCAYCVLSRQTANVEREAVKFAMTVARRIRRKNFGFDELGEPERISAMPGSFRPGQKGYESWAVTWEATLDLPAEDDAAAEITPFQILHANVNLLEPDATDTEMDIELEQ